MAFVSSSSCCRAAFSQSSSLQFRFPLVRAFCVLSVGLTNLSPSSTSIIKTGCAQSHPLLPFLRKLTILRKDKGKSQQAEEEDMFLCQSLRTRKRVTFLVLMTMMMMMSWRFIITMSKFNSQSSAKAIQSTRMEGNASTVPSIVVYVTVPNKEAGKKLAGSIIKEKLAACVNRVPGIESVYWWEGEINANEPQ
ncbi:protein CutA, chloroplastic isoform X2 [Magnolia sinica]|uniref:protein CutA, chloroplastic isoform X2 n=1 Tax=Magnolia sinica TaxID=86752 RepID=UPI00265B00D6|nr:protein CutA, chloroplastic isoform X2 [Magnolia sinica]